MSSIDALELTNIVDSEETDDDEPSDSLRLTNEVNVDDRNGSTNDSDEEVSSTRMKIRRLFSCGDERVWATVLSVIVASLPALLFGCTLGFPSPVLLDLMELDQQEYQFDTLLSDLFSVSA